MNYSNIPTNANDPDTDVWDGDDQPDSGTNDDGSGFDSLDGSDLGNT